MTRWIEAHFGLVMLLGCAAGMLFPFGAAIPETIVIPSLATVTFLSLFKTEAGFSAKLIKQSLLFSALRFALLPLLMYYIATWLVPHYALAVLLVALLPAGVSSTAFTQIFGGNVLLTVSITLVSSVLAVALIPLSAKAISGQTIHINSAALFVTLFICIILPMILHRLVKNHAAIKRSALSYGKCLSISLIAFNVFVVTTKQRAFLLENPFALLEPFAVALACYALFAVCYAAKTTQENKITYGVTSLFNNCTLGITISLLYFPPHITLTMAASVLIWILLPLPLQYLARRTTKEAF